MSLSDLGLIGNCQLSALVRRDGAIVWSCMPRFDSPSVFAKLLDEREGGAFTIAPADGRTRVQRYLPNTNVLETLFEGPDGAFRILDFAPGSSSTNVAFDRPSSCASSSLLAVPLAFA